ncbi:MAG: STT3 domain-containing protein [Candidatus Micrarchaeia archaeon]
MDQSIQENNNSAIQNPSNNQNLTNANSINIGSNENKENNERNKRLKINIQSIQNNKYTFIIVALLILIIALYVRLPMLRIQGLFEPDGYYYYTMIKQSVAQGFILPKYINLSGYPTPNPRGEDPGLLYMTTIPYFFLRFFGISILDIMRVMGPVFGVLDAIAAYFLAKYLSKSRLLGLLTMLFVALSSGNIARTAALVYRGDTWVSFFIMVALIILLAIVYQNDKRKKYIYTIIAGVWISFGFLIWTGGVIVPELFMLSAGALTFYAFIIKDNKLNFDVALMLVASFISYILDLAYTALDISYPTLITGNGFFILFLPIAASLLASYLLVSEINKNSAIGKYFGNYKKRLAFVIVIIGLAVISVLSISSLSSFVTNGHAIYQQSNIGVTTEELQRPSISFLFSSFGFQLILAPLGILLFIFLAHLHDNETKMKINKFTFNMSSAFVVMLVYFIVMAYLQGGAIRFNSMLSLPIAIFSAYAIYIIYLFFSPFYINIKNSKIPTVAIYLGFVIAIIVLQFSMVYSSSIAQVGSADGVNPMFFQALEWMSNNTPINSRILALWPDGSLVEAIGNRTSFMDSVGGENSIRIEQYHSYLFNGTPDNAYLYNKAFKPNYILARNFWYDELAGIAIEGNITNPIPVKGSMHCSDSASICTLNVVSLSKSNPGVLNGTVRMQYNSSGAISLINGFGTSNIMIDGLGGGQVIFSGNIASESGAWSGSISFAPYSELVGNLNINGLSKSNLQINGSIEDNLNDYGFTPFANYTYSNNSTSNLYIFSNPPNGYKAVLVMTKPTLSSNTISNTPTVYGLLGFANSNNYTYIKNIEFMNTTNYDYNIITSPYNKTANYTLLIEYSGTQIGTAILVSPKLFRTNLYKMLNECGFNSCALSSGNVTAQLVYANGDSKIIKMNYT